MSEGWPEAKLAAAKLLSPLFMLMAVGWLAYPYATGYLSELEDVAVNMSSIWLVSISAAAISAALSMGLTIYFFANRKPDWHVHAPEGSEVCAFCGADVKPETNDCPVCARRLR